ncbi:predicted protein [Postia placenta Mad-698-R]|nr:predicted protein [Postia placenta Mad-698-R]
MCSAILMAALLPFAWSVSRAYNLVKEYSVVTAPLVHHPPQSNTSIHFIMCTGDIFWVRSKTQDVFPIGSVFVIDLSHIPYGCSVWPSFWTQGVNCMWPYGSEIDIIKMINLMPLNQYALHTGNSVGITSTSAMQSSTIINTNCSTPPGSSSAGCTISEPNKNSVGAVFAAADGGMYVTLFDTMGIFIWFWSHMDVNLSTARKQVHARLCIPVVYGRKLTISMSYRANIIKVWDGGRGTGMWVFCYTKGSMHAKPNVVQCADQEETNGKHTGILDDTGLEFQHFPSILQES